MEKLGINPVLLLTQIVNFFIMLGVLTYLVYKPVLRTLEKREKKIKEGVGLQEELQREKEKIAAIKKRIISEANEERKRLIKEAIEEAKKKSQLTFSEEKKKIEEERRKMFLQVKREQEKNINQAKKQALDYALLISEKLLKEKLDKKVQETILKAYLEKKGKLSLLPQIVEILKKEVQEKEFQGEVLSAIPLDKNQIKKMEDFLREKLKRKVRIKNVVDKKIIGGLVVRFKDFLVDESLRGELTRIKEQVYGD